MRRTERGLPKPELNYWVFSNNPTSSYLGIIWDHGTTVRSNRYYFEEDEPNRKKIRTSDVVILRVFGVTYVGRFEVGDWHGGEEWTEDAGRKLTVRFFEMKKVNLWKGELPQELIIRDLSSEDSRGRWKWHRNRPSTSSSGPCIFSGIASRVRSSDSHGPDVAEPMRPLGSESGNQR